MIPDPLLMGAAVGRNPTDKGKPGSKHHVLTDRQGIKRAVTMRPFGRDVVALEAAMVVGLVTDAHALLRS